MDENQKLVEEKKQTRFGKKSIILVLVFIIGVVALILLSLNFTFTYQFKEADQDTEINPWQEETKFITPMPSPQEKQSEDVEINKTAHNANASCKDLLSFMQDFYNVKLQAEKGQDFSNALLELNKYKVQSAEINQYLVTLTNLAKSNKEDEYFRIKFKFLIREIYNSNQQQNNILYQYFGDHIKKVIFIRPIGERAIANDGLDMNIALTEKALINNNLVLANSYIEKLPNNSEELKKLQAEIQNQQTIRETIGYLDKASKLECNIVSKESK